MPPHLAACSLPSLPSRCLRCCRDSHCTPHRRSHVASAAPRFTPHTASTSSCRVGAPCRSIRFYRHRGHPQWRRRARTRDHARSGLEALDRDSRVRARRGGHGEHAGRPPSPTRNTRDCLRDTIDGSRLNHESGFTHTTPPPKLDHRSREVADD